MLAPGSCRELVFNTQLCQLVATRIRREREPQLTPVRVSGSSLLFEPKQEHLSRVSDADAVRYRICYSGRACSRASFSNAWPRQQGRQEDVSTILPERGAETVHPLVPVHRASVVWPSTKLGSHRPAASRQRQVPFCHEPCFLSVHALQKLSRSSKPTGLP